MHHFYCMCMCTDITLKKIFTCLIWHSRKWKQDPNSTFHVSDILTHLRLSENCRKFFWSEKLKEQGYLDFLLPFQVERLIVVDFVCVCVCLWVCKLGLLILDCSLIGHNRYKNYWSENSQKILFWTKWAILAQVLTKITKACISGSVVRIFVKFCCRTGHNN